MPFDITAANRAATQSGLALGQAMFNNNLRMQQLKSQQALQQLQERQAAEMLSWTMRQHQAAIQEEADVAKANSVFQAMQTPTIQVPTGMGGAVPIPNPVFTPNTGEAYMKAYGGLAKTQDQAGKVLLNAATLNLRQAQATDELKQAQVRGQPVPRAPSLVAADKALVEQRESATDLNEARITQIREGKGNASADPDWVRGIKFYEERTGKKLSDSEIKELWDVRSGLKPRAAVTRAKSEGDYISQHIDKAMEQAVIPAGKDKQGKERFRLPSSRKEAVDYLRGEYATLFDGASSTSAPIAPTPPEASATPVEDEKVIVVSPDGRKGRIPRSQLKQAIEQGYKEYEG